jgi:CRISPR/Cas system-associated protein Csm6
MHRYLLEMTHILVHKAGLDRQKAGALGVFFVAEKTKDVVIVPELASLGNMAWR